MPHRLKVLASAYACEPEKGSEPGAGWNWVKQIARFHEVWVITRANNRLSIDQALSKSRCPASTGSILIFLGGFASGSVGSTVHASTITCGKVVFTS